MTGDAPQGAAPAPANAFSRDHAMKRHILMTAATALLLTAPGIGVAQQPTPSARTQAQLSQQDQSFAETVALSDQFEIQAAQLAIDKARSADVKTFARQMVDDHGKTSATMKTLAERKAIALPVKLDAEHQRKVDQLRAQSGESFDSAYVQGQVEAHRAAVSLFDRQVAQGQDTDLKQFAQQTLPTLKQHLQHVQDLRTVQTSTNAQPAADRAGNQASFAAMIGNDVYGEGGDKLGRVSDIILDAQSGSATAVILERGGVLGVGAKRVALDYALLESRGDRVVARDLTEDQVKAMPGFQYDDTTVSLGTERSDGKATGRPANPQ